MYKEYAAIDSLTEYQRNYKLINLNILHAFLGIQPAIEGDIALRIFLKTMTTKRYRNTKEKRENDDHFAEEDRRIYNTIPLTPEDLLIESNLKKYENNPELVKNNVGNYRGKYLLSLQENNVFFQVIHKSFPQTRVFIFNRSIAMWKYYNSEGCVIPRFVRKVLNVSDQLSQQLLSFAKKQEKNITIKDANSCVGRSISQIISQMNVQIASRFPRWNDDMILEDYVEKVHEILDGMTDVEGFKIAKDFTQNLPLTIRSKYMSYKQHEKQQLEKELMASNSNLCRKRRSKKINASHVTSKTTTEGRNAEICSFYTDPFENEVALVKYYHSLLKEKNVKAALVSVECEVSSASRIFDLLKDNDLENKLPFLRGWIDYYTSRKLFEKRIFNTKHTALSEFIKTFSEYKAIHLD